MSLKKLKKQTLGGIKWGIIDKAFNISIQLIIGVVLARLLPPEDFGLIGLAMIIVGFSQIAVDLGLGPALIQKKDITERHVRVCFTTSFLLGILVALIVYFSSPLLAVFLGSVKVKPIIEALSILFIFKGLEIASYSVLQKKLNFKIIFYKNFACSLCYGVLTIVLALNGYGVWSLVIGNITNNVLGFVINYAMVRHSIVPLWSKKELKDLSHFGVGMTINKVFNYFALQGDFFFIGRILGPYTLGIYTRAYNLMQMPTKQFVMVLSNVVFPAASVIQNDELRTRLLFERAIKMISFVLTPLCFLMVVLAPEIILGVYGEKWHEAIVPLQILSIVGFLRGTYNLGGAFLRAKGLVYKLFISNVVYGVTMILGVWIGATYFSLKVACLAVCFSIVAIWLLVMYFNAKELSLKLGDILKFHLPGVVLGIITVGGVYFSKFYINYLFEGHYLIILFVSGVLWLLFSFLTLRFIPNKLFMGIPLEFKEVILNSRINEKVKKVISKMFRL